MIENPTSIRFNSYTVDDAVSFLQRIKHKGVSGIATSPPYNKAFSGRGKKPGSNWKNSKLMADNYSHFDDILAEEQLHQTNGEDRVA